MSRAPQTAETANRVARHVADFVRVPAAALLMALALALASKWKVAVPREAWDRCRREGRCFTDNWGYAKLRLHRRGPCIDGLPGAGRRASAPHPSVSKGRAGAQLQARRV